jgi:S-adenosylmethionine:tRNA ribosyltransferase-isomerase
MITKTSLKEFKYNLPGELIAQEPRASRDASRMMVVHRKGAVFEDRVFRDLTDFLRQGDCLVINNSKVIPARLLGRKPTGGMVEVLLLSESENDRRSGNRLWEVLLKPARRVAPGMRLTFDKEGEAEVIERVSEKKWVLRFFTDIEFDEFVSRHGRMPLPPYIRRKDGEGESLDRIRYQTVYARVPGSVAAPTAGLHFSQDLLNRLMNQGVHIAAVTLHVGYGTFLPVEAPFVEDHVMEKEFYEISDEEADRINKADRVIAVGTTSSRVMESASDVTGRVRSGSGFTSLYIYPGYRFKKTDGLITNFHLPRSSLFIFVCAFAGMEMIKKAYANAIGERYRFYSYGDCMLII